MNDRQNSSEKGKDPYGWISQEQVMYKLGLKYKKDLGGWKTVRKILCDREQHDQTCREKYA